MEKKEDVMETADLRETDTVEDNKELKKEELFKEIRDRYKSDELDDDVVGLVVDNV